MATLKRIPTKYAIVIGIIVGALLGAALAKGVLSIVYWRREAQVEEQMAADNEAYEAAERLKAKERAASDAEWRRLNRERDKR